MEGRGLGRTGLVALQRLLVEKGPYQVDRSRTASVPWGLCFRRGTGAALGEAVVICNGGRADRHRLPLVWNNVNVVVGLGLSLSG